MQRVKAEKLIIDLKSKQWWITKIWRYRKKVHKCVVFIII